MEISATQDHEVKVGDVIDFLTNGNETATLESDRSIDLHGDAADPLMARVVHVHQHTVWSESENGSVSAAIDTQISGAPLSVSGTYRVEPTPTGCRSIVELQLECAMAILGGRLLASVGPLAIRTLEDELARLDTALLSER